MSIFLLLLFVMVFLHIVDDFYLQGWLAQGKTKSWWEKNCPNELYSRDYIMCLFMHGFSNSFIVHLPLLFLLGNDLIFLSIFVYAIIHAIIDDLKANKSILNLIQDQTLHIICIWIIVILFL